MLINGRTMSKVNFAGLTAGPKKDKDGEGSKRESEDKETKMLLGKLDTAEKKYYGLMANIEKVKSEIIDLKTCEADLWLPITPSMDFSKVGYHSSEGSLLSTTLDTKEADKTQPSGIFSCMKSPFSNHRSTEALTEEIVKKTIPNMWKMHDKFANNEEVQECNDCLTQKLGALKIAKDNNDKKEKRALKHQLIAGLKYINQKLGNDSDETYESAEPVTSKALKEAMGIADKNLERTDKLIAYLADACYLGTGIAAGGALGLFGPTNTANELGSAFLKGPGIEAGRYSKFIEKVRDKTL